MVSEARADTMAAVGRTPSQLPVGDRLLRFVRVVQLFDHLGISANQVTAWRAGLGFIADLPLVLALLLAPKLPMEALASMVFGLLLHALLDLGDALDGALARFQKEKRRRAGSTGSAEERTISMKGALYDPLADKAKVVITFAPGLVMCWDLLTVEFSIIFICIWLVIVLEIGQAIVRIADYRHNASGGNRSLRAIGIGKAKTALTFCAQYAFYLWLLAPHRWEAFTWGLSATLGIVATLTAMSLGQKLWARR